MPSHCPLLFPPLLLLFGNWGWRTCFPFSGLRLSTPLNLPHSRTIPRFALHALFALHTLFQIPTTIRSTSFFVRSYTTAPLTSLPLTWRASLTYYYWMSMRRSCITRSRPHSGRPTCRKRHTWQALTSPWTVFCSGNMTARFFRWSSRSQNRAHISYISCLIVEAPSHSSHERYVESLNLSTSLVTTNNAF